MNARAAARGLLLFACVLTAKATPAFAQSTSQVAAEALFREARRLVDVHRYLEACEKFAASQRLDPAVGTLLNLGRSYEKIGRTATAWATYQEAIAVAKATGQSEREQIARGRSDDLEPALPRLTIVISPQANVVDLRLSRDGEPVTSELWGVTFPVDPGEHSIEATAPARIPFAAKVIADAGRAVTITVPALQPIAESPAITSVDRQDSHAPALPPDAQPSTRGHIWNGQRTAALAFGVTGLAGVAVVVIEGLQFERKKSAANEACPGTCTVPQQYALSHAYRDDAKNARTLVIVGGIVGVVGVVGAAAFWLTASGPSAATASWQMTPLVGARALGLGMGGKW